MKTDCSSDTFYRVHSRIIWCNNIAGIVAPSFPYKGKLYRTLLEVYVFVLNFLSVVCTVSTIGGVLFLPDVEFITVSSSGTVASTLVYVTTIGLLAVGKRREFSDLSERAGRMFDMCSNDPLDVNCVFTKRFNRNITLLINYSTYLLGLTTVAAVGYVLPGYVQNFESLNFGGEPHLECPLWMPFDYTESPYFDMAFFIELMSLLLSAWRKTCSECLLLSYLHCQIQYLRHMKHTFKRVFGEGNDSDELKLQVSDPIGKAREEENKSISNLSSQEEKLKHWITMHQEVLKMGKIMMHTYNGIIATYMASIIVIVTFSMFTALQKEPGPEEKIQIAGVLFYALTTMCSYYLLCHFGNLVQFESQTVAQLGYFSTWFDADKNIKNNMKIIFERTQSPLLVTAFGSPMFDVSKETYLAFVKSIVSFYLTLSHFNDKFKK